MADIRLESFPFPSKLSGYDDYGNPVYDRAAGSASMRAVFKEFFSNGVFDNEGTTFNVSPADGLKVKVEPGVAIIEGAFGIIPESVTLTVEEAAPVGKYAYGIFLRCDDNVESRSIYLTVRKGSAGESPTAPEPNREDPGIWELRIATVVLESGAESISAEDITNEQGEEFCPFTLPFAELDLSVVTIDARNTANEALTALLEYFSKYRGMVDAAVSETLAGQLQQQIIAIQEQLENFDLSGSVDNETIGYSEKPGESTKTLHVNENAIDTKHLVDGSVTLEKLSQDVMNHIDEPVFGLDPAAYTIEELVNLVLNNPIEKLSYMAGKFTCPITVAGYGTFKLRIEGVGTDVFEDGKTNKMTFSTDRIITKMQMDSENTIGQLNDTTYHGMDCQIFFESEEFLQAWPEALQTSIKPIKHMIPQCTKTSTSGSAAQTAQYQNVERYYKFCPPISVNDMGSTQQERMRMNLDGIYSDYTVLTIYQQNYYPNYYRQYFTKVTTSGESDEYAEPDLSDNGIILFFGI